MKNFHVKTVKVAVSSHLLQFLQGILSRIFQLSDESRWKNKPARVVSCGAFDYKDDLYLNR